MQRQNTPTILDGYLDSSIQRAVDLLRNNELVGMPTETVYGLAGLATSEPAVNKIFAVKQRPTTHPLIVHIAHYTDIDKWSRDITSYTRVLCETCWPGPLTVLVRRSSRVLDAVTGGRDTVAIRVPAHDVALRLLSALGDGVVAPSANRFGRVSPTTAQHVAYDLGADVAAILDGGTCSIGVESTILDCTSTEPQLLRPGAITIEQIEAVLERPITGSSGESRASGMLDKHYTPNCRVEIVESNQAAQQRVEQLLTEGTRAEVLDFPLDLVEYARNLYSRLRDADSRRVAVVVAVLPAPQGLGFAIRDRLLKASRTTTN